MECHSHSSDRTKENQRTTSRFGLFEFLRSLSIGIYSERIAHILQQFPNPISQDNYMEDLKNAIGQFVLYRAVMRKTDPERILYLAVRDITFNSLFEEPVGQLLIADETLNLIVFEAQNEVIVQWIP